MDDVDLRIEKGATLGVVGESGCGKSTLGRAILRLQEPTGGEVLFKGENILAYGKKEMAAACALGPHLGYISQMQPDMVPAIPAAKLTVGILAVLVVMLKRSHRLKK